MANMSQEHPYLQEISSPVAAARDHVGAEPEITAAEFPVGVRVHIVDDGPDCLRDLAPFLQQCSYEVIVATDVTGALELLRPSPDIFDILITNSGIANDFNFIQRIVEHMRMTMPLMMVSPHNRVQTVMIVDLGVVHFVAQSVQHIWQFVYKAKFVKIPESSLPFSDASASIATSTHALAIAQAFCRDPHQEEAPAPKKRRFKWNDGFNGIFMEAVQELGGLKQAEPKKILALMRRHIPDITREQVASHLQKSRIRERIAAHRNAGAPTLINRETSTEVTTLNNSTTSSNLMHPEHHPVGSNPAAHSLLGQPSREPHGHGGNQIQRPTFQSLHHLVLDQQRKGSHVCGPNQMHPDAAALRRWRDDHVHPNTAVSQPMHQTEIPIQLPSQMNHGLDRHNMLVDAEREVHGCRDIPAQHVDGNREDAIHCVQMGIPPPHVPMRHDDGYKDNEIQPPPLEIPHSTPSINGTTTNHGFRGMNLPSIMNSFADIEFCEEAFKYLENSPFDSDVDNTRSIM